MSMRVIAGSMILVGAAAAQGAITFTFADPTAMSEMSHTGGLLSYNADAIDFTIHSTEAGYAGETYEDATLSFTATAVDGGSFGPFQAGLVTTTTFEFRDNAGDLLLSGSFTNGTLALINDVGGITADEDASFGGLTYTAHGDFLADLQAANLELAPEFDAAFTLTNIEFGSPGQGLADFTANSAFTGTAHVIPTPGALALAGFGGLAAIRRRTRS